MQLTPSGRRFIAISVIVVVLINALVTLWLVRTVISQGRDIRTLQRNDKVTKAVEDVNSKVDTLKSRIEGLFR
jgi:hypothetical protein